MFRHRYLTRIGLALVVSVAAWACGDANLLPPATLAVRRLWQFAHRTWHEAISASSRAREDSC